MQLGNILSTASEPVAYKPVKFRVLVSQPGQPQKRAMAEAVLAFVDEETRADAKKLAGASLRPGEDPDDAESYWFLMAALRDKDDPACQFCPNAEYSKFRSSLISKQVSWLLKEYRLFVRDEYPEIMTAEEVKELQEQAGK